MKSGAPQGLFFSPTLGGWLHTGKQGGQGCVGNWPPPLESLVLHGNVVRKAHYSFYAPYIDH